VCQTPRKFVRYREYGTAPLSLGGIGFYQYVVSCRSVSASLSVSAASRSFNSNIESTVVVKRDGNTFHVPFVLAAPPALGVDYEMLFDQPGPA